MSGIGVLLPLAAYGALLFAVAAIADRSRARPSAAVYVLSLGVYCTSWTYYGSVGRASARGIDFLPIYLGPTLVCVLGWPVLAKILRISKAHRITSLADFIATRYGRSALLAGLVTLIAVIGSVPYIALQLKAVSASLMVVLGGGAGWSGGIAEGTLAFGAALLLALFGVLFGTAHIDPDEHHRGMVAAIALESVVKLVCLVAVGLFTGLVLFEGFPDLFARAATLPQWPTLARLATPPAEWTGLVLVAMAAAICLPRQFHMLVVENRDERHLAPAMWGFPLYLFVINLFVLPIALAGLLLLPAGSDRDMVVLTLPLSAGAQALSVAALIGGLSAATAMVVVESVALSTMVCNDLVMPLLLRFAPARQRDLTRLLLAIRRAAILGVVLLGFLYMQRIGNTHALVSIGLVSFAAAAQFAPAILLGLFWRRASRPGAILGIGAGFLVWMYTLFLPSLALSEVLPRDFLERGLFGLDLLRPQALFGLAGLDPITHSLFWSILANAGLLVAVSVLHRPTALERAQARAYVDVFAVQATPGPWRGGAPIADLAELLGRFIGPERARERLAAVLRARGADPRAQMAEAAVVQEVERLLAGMIGGASAGVLVASVAGERPVGVDEVIRIVDESSQIREYSRQLEQKSRELEATTGELRRANATLQQLDRLKDEFVSNVSHELRTPLTSIRSFSEILLEEPDLDPARRQEFLGIILRESERLTRLITDMLDLAKMQAGELHWNFAPVDLAAILRDAAAATGQLFRDRSIMLSCEIATGLPAVRADADRIAQVVINLLSNAVKFSPAGTGRVRLVLRRAEGGQAIEVIDNGPGIAPEDQGTIFERFRQAGGDTLTGKPAGTGLGLAICRTIMQRHAGTLAVESQPGRGAIFRAVLPEDT
ncbi:Histidine kinase [Rhodovastum atsumiense]|uniref:histidine kinase n=1 Tax=Rhodovastum atsumiense TaxID=504468 RepID=A0A5M6IW86_9PROT|nr:ATP-binding protein [Rhodovastum atsumiense]KAA5612087.1 histidine kinase [Rhodovastum atsumiense]CAH2604038.1 Histidine kinase [Rhodovastum atsumiense]